MTPAHRSTRRIYRVLARLLPARFRSTHVELEDAAVACVARGRDKAGVRGVVLAWLAIAADTIVTAWTARADERRRRGGFDRWRTDTRDAWRTLTARRASSVAMVSMLGLGVGLVSTMFALADPYVLRPLPYGHPEELVLIRVGHEGLTPDAVVPTVDEWRQRRTLFKGLTAFACCADELRLPAASALFRPWQVTSDFFRVLEIEGPVASLTSEGAGGVQPLILTPAGAGAMREPVTTGSLLHGQKSTYQIVGTLRPPFVFPDPAGAQAPVFTAFVPTTVATTRWVQTPDGRTIGGLGSGGPSIVARLQPGITPQIVRQALAVRLPSGRQLDVRVTPLTIHMRGDLVRLGWGALIAGIIVLAVCAANIGNLLLARGVWRVTEFRTRLALGATPHDLFRLRLVEITILGIGAAAAGLGVTSAALVVLSRVIPDEYVTLGVPAMTVRVGMCALVGTVTVLGVALLPAIGRSRPSRPPRLRESAAGDRRTSLFRMTFTASQSAMVMVLAIAAAMLMQSLYNLMRQTTGYDTSSLSISVAYPRPAVFTEREGLFGNHLDEVFRTIVALRNIPEVTAAGATTASVVGDAMVRKAFLINGTLVSVDAADVTPQFFEASGMRLVAGRRLGDDDGHGRGAVVNETFVRTFWPDGVALGRALPMGAGRVPATVVGVVRDAYDASLDQAPTPTVYTLLDAGDRMIGTIRFAVAGLKLTPASEAAIRRAVHAVGPATVVTTVDTIGSRLIDSVRTRIFTALILGLFGVVGAVIAIAGLASVVAFLIARRTREIAIRIALGADAGSVRRLVTQEALGAAIVGGVAGLAVGQVAARSLESLVYGLVAGNWTTSLGAGLAITLVEVLTALAMAQRAVALRPGDALKVE